MLNDIIEFQITGFGSPTIADKSTQPGGVRGGFFASIGLLLFTGFGRPPAGWLWGAAFKEDTLGAGGTYILV